MAQLLDIQKVQIGPDSLVATVRVSDGAPLMTSEDVEATARVYWLMPEIADHVCVGEGAETFKDVMGDTELAHLMEHVTLELLARSNMAGDISSARTQLTEIPRTYEIKMACPDDVLVCSALSSAAWIIQWAFGGGDAASKPNIEAIVAGIVNLTANSYLMEGNEAPMPGSNHPAAEEVVEEETVEEEVDEGAPDEPEVADVAEVEEVEVDVADPDGDGEYEVQEEEDDPLAGYDLTLPGKARPRRTERSVVREDLPTVHTLGDEVGFMDGSDGDPLA